ncbi:hypothetical protein lerEdw1_010539 [Lerista edwardsae]|nr:hypothetical protein lerEdw1_010539 [Lerista edwardsae]
MMLGHGGVSISEKLQKFLGPLEQKLHYIACCKSQEEKKPGELKDVKNTFDRCKEVQAKEPNLISIELEKNFCNFPRQYFVLRKIIKRLTALLAVFPFEEENASTGDPTHWALGVCNDSVSRKGETTSLPETGYWRVRLFNGDKYAATTTPFTPLNVTVKPKRVGVFLDYDAGKLSFYNVTDRSHMYTFTDTFTEKLWPFFYPGIRAGRKNAAPLIIRPPTDWD